jgi:hypothetical protein
VAGWTAARTATAVIASAHTRMVERFAISLLR